MKLKQKLAILFALAVSSVIFFIATPHKVFADKFIDDSYFQDPKATYTVRSCGNFDCSTYGRDGSSYPSDLDLNISGVTQPPGVRFNDGNTGDGTLNLGFQSDGSFICNTKGHGEGIDIHKGSLQVLSDQSGVQWDATIHIRYVTWVEPPHTCKDGINPRTLTPTDIKVVYTTDAVCISEHDSCGPDAAIPVSITELSIPRGEGADNGCFNGSNIEYRGKCQSDGKGWTTKLVCFNSHWGYDPSMDPLKGECGPQKGEICTNPGEGGCDSNGTCTDPSKGCTGDGKNDLNGSGSH